VVLVNGWYILGEEVKALKICMSYCGTNYCIERNDGLDALTSFFKNIQLGRLQKGMKLLFLQTLILPVFWLFLKRV
jgi:hypothetical protein